MQFEYASYSNVCGRTQDQKFQPSKNKVRWSLDSVVQRCIINPSICLKNMSTFVLMVPL